MEGAAVGEDDQVLLGEVLDDLELLTVDVELLLKSLDDVVGVGVVAVAAKPADRRPADDLVSPSLDGPRRGHSADHQVRAGTRVPRPRVSRHGRRLAFGNLQVRTPVHPGRLSSSGRWGRVIASSYHSFSFVPLFKYPQTPGVSAFQVPKKLTCQGAMVD